MASPAALVLARDWPIDAVTMSNLIDTSGDFGDIFEKMLMTRPQKMRAGLTSSTRPCLDAHSALWLILGLAIPHFMFLLASKWCVVRIFCFSSSKTATPNKLLSNYEL
jgi:hypothetical protein